MNVVEQMLEEVKTEETHQNGEEVDTHQNGEAAEVRCELEEEQVEQPIAMENNGNDDHRNSGVRIDSID